ncbi:MAG: hypothetical protein IPM37_07410 [Hahellaceae bacterium]|nr:hypothetical protein [Hahellaceae bacterium]
MLTTPRLSGAVLLTLLCTASTQVMADNQQLKEAQQKLNQQVLERPFSTPDPVAVETYIRDAAAGNMQPRSQPPSYWRDGYTCDNARNYDDYMDCQYYYRRSGGYWIIVTP